MDVRFAPFHNFAQLRPVVHLLEGQVLHRRAGDEQSVELLVLHVGKPLVKRQHVLLRRILGYTARRHDQLQLNLQRGISQHAGKLRFGIHLGGHQIEKQNAQRPDILRQGAGFRHHEDVFTRQGFGSRKLVGNLDGHRIASL